MPEKNSPPSFAQALLRIHRVISRGLIVAVQSGGDFIQAGFPEPGLRIGFVLYLQALVAVLGAHHLGEEQIAFPALRDKLTDAPYDRLARHHQEIVALLDSLRKLIPSLEAGGDPVELTALVECLRKISAIWRPHIQAEEWYFSEDALDAAMSAQDQGRLSAAFGKHSQEHALPAHLVLPFLLFNLAGDDRSQMAASLPATVVEQLVPKAWKEQWAPMQPFLLE